jgi:hypothetical protein
MSSTEHDIKGVDKADLLTRLWFAQKQISSFVQCDGKTATMADVRQKATMQLDQGHRIDYFLGRKMGMELQGDTCSSYLYDRDAGVGTFQRVLDEMLHETLNITPRSPP